MPIATVSAGDEVKDSKTNEIINQVNTNTTGIASLDTRTTEIEKFTGAYVPVETTDDLNALIAANAAGTRFLLLPGTHTITEEIAPAAKNPTIVGASRKNCIITTASTTITLFHAQGQMTLASVTLQGSGKDNSNIGLLLHGDETNGATNCTFDDIDILDCEVGIELEDNTWNNQFHNVYISKVDKGVYGKVVGAGTYNGENASFSECWVSYDGAVVVDYAFYFEKTNALKITNTEVLTPVYDGLYIGISNGDGWDIIAGSAFDVCGRHGVNIGAGGAGSKIDFQGCWLKGGATDAENGHALIAVDTDHIVINGGQCLSYPASGTGTHHGIFLTNCDFLRLSDAEIYGHENTLGDAVRLTNSQYCTLTNFHISNAQYVVQETGTCDYNTIDGFTWGGIDTAGTPVVLVGASSLAFYNDITISAHKTMGATRITGILSVLGNEIKLGATANKSFAIYTGAGTDKLEFGTGSSYTGGVFFTCGTVFKVQGATIMSDTGYQAADGTGGASGTVTLAATTTITVKNGLITAWS